MIAVATRPELRLLLACARVRLEPGDRAAAEEALGADLDWALLLRLARWHGLRPLLHRHLGGLGPGRVPRPVLVELWGEAETIARRNRALAAELTHVAAVLEANGIPALPYKGPTLALQAYGDVGLREFGDLDILVAKRDVLRARDALCHSDYEPEYPLRADVEQAFLASGAQYHLVLRSPALGHLVELHWKTDPDFPVERAGDAAWWEGTARAGSLRAFDAQELMLVLCVHGSKHLWASLGWLVDVAELIRRDSAIDWDALARRARAGGCARGVGLGLRLAADLLGAPLAPAARALAMTPEVEPLLPAVARPMLAASPGPLPMLQGWALALALREGMRARIRWVVRVVWLPSLVEWTRWPLPRPLFFAYPGLRVGRLAAKYLHKGVELAFRGRWLQS
jgi:hypothetical protein